MMHLYQRLSENTSKLTTQTYSTSFASAIRLLHKDLRQPIYNIYGFVRLADEIVDSFHDHDKKKLLSDFKIQTEEAIRKKISLNPILQGFQATVHHYKIGIDLIGYFFESMEMDLSFRKYDADLYKRYIYGSAEVVGLMCLLVFCEGSKERYEELKPYAQSLGAAFQKVNFLRDIQSDYHSLNRTYFPDVDFSNFSEYEKSKIVRDIEQDFRMAYQGIILLPKKAKFGVYVAYRYYYSLFKKIRRSHSSVIFKQRFRVPDHRKALIVLGAGVKNQFRMI